LSERSFSCLPERPASFSDSRRREDVFTGIDTFPPLFGVRNRRDLKWRSFHHAMQILTIPELLGSDSMWSCCAT
jgi:hypothetical protein